MKLSIRQLLFLAILIPNLLVAVGLYAANSWSFRSGFLNYVNQSEQKRLEPLLDNLAERFEQQGNWDWALAGGRRGEWSQLIRQHLSDHSHRKDRDGGAPKLPLSFDPRLLLANAERQLLIGEPRHADSAVWNPIMDDDKVVGFLGYRPRERLMGALDTLFAQRQQHRFGQAALVLIAVSALLAFLLSSRLVSPIRNINQAIRKLAQGNYQSRADDHPSIELGQLAGDVNRLAETLQKNLISRQQWIADISHELRTPVAVLQGEIEAMQDGVRNTDEQSLASLHAETLRLSKLVNDLHELTLSDLGALSYSMETVDLGLLVDECLDSQSSGLYKAGLKVQWTSPTAPVFINGDRQRLTQMLRNLAQNSLRYTEAGGDLNIALATSNQQTILRWQDSSPGVEKRHLPHLFDRLYRAEASRNRELGGSGLGLSIVRNIVEAHQGTVKAEASPLGGLAIVVTLPLHPPQH